MKKRILSAPTSENFADALSAWRLLLVAALIGGLIGAAIYQLWIPPYRAMSKVVVDQNLEQALPAAPDREVFYFLERETQKLEELAWSDAVLEQVADAGRRCQDFRSPWWIAPTFTARRWWLAILWSQ